MSSPSGFYQEGEYYSFAECGSDDDFTYEPDNEPPAQKSKTQQQEDQYYIDMENQRIQAFIDSSPYPTYEEATTRFKEISNTRKGLIFHLSEYSEWAHEFLSILYRDWTKPDIKKKLRWFGEQIDKRGGMDAMRGVFYVFCHTCPMSSSNINSIRYQYKLLEYAWDGVGEWKS